MVRTLARQAADQAFYDADRKLYADDLQHTAFSEHAQSLALLAGAKYGETAVRTMLQESLARTTVYFDHYLFEALQRIGRTDVLLDRLGLWYGLLERGLRTVIEHPEPTRSDCHAWGRAPSAVSSGRRPRCRRRTDRWRCVRWRAARPR